MTELEHKKLIFDTCLKMGVTDTLQIAYVLATAGIESRYGKQMRELYNGDPETYFEGKYGMKTHMGKILGNDRPGDGYRFRGRGYVQITGRSNYSRFSFLIYGYGNDLIENPELASRPEVAAKILIIGMRDGLFTGHKLADYLLTEKLSCDLEGARKIVNPGEGTRRIKEFEIEFAENIEYINLS